MLSAKTFPLINIMNQEFQEWLDQCPVQWFLLNDGAHFINSDCNHKSYEFIFEEEDEPDESTGWN